MMRSKEKEEEEEEWGGRVTMINKAMYTTELLLSASGAYLL